MSATGRTLRAESQDHGIRYVEVIDPTTGEPVDAEPARERERA